MQGKIIKGIAGFYYVHIPGDGIYECKAKGIFRKDNKKPLVGDNVEMDVIDQATKKGNIVAILQRKNELIRPAVANVDQAIVIFALAKPDPNLPLLDRFLIMMEQQGIPCKICFNKADLVDREWMDKLKAEYELAGYEVAFVSAREQMGTKVIETWLQEKTSTVAGPSGVGKSSLINGFQDIVNMETGAISEKIERGRHTTRHAQIIPVNENSYIIDTPGFSSLSLMNVEKEDLRFYYPEFSEYENCCRYHGCLHDSEPECAVKEALQEGRIGANRYANYISFLQELRNVKKY